MRSGSTTRTERATKISPTVGGVNADDRLEPPVGWTWHRFQWSSDGHLVTNNRSALADKASRKLGVCRTLPLVTPLRGKSGMGDAGGERLLTTVILFPRRLRVSPMSILGPHDSRAKDAMARTILVPLFGLLGKSVF